MIEKNNAKDYAEWCVNNWTPETLMMFWNGTYKKRNDALFKHMQPYLPDHAYVLDLAAGSSYLAEKFLTLENVKSYTWNDINPVLINMVDNRVADERFKIDNFDAEDMLVDFSNFNVFICVSLEHLENDISIMDRLSKGCIVGLCSPNFGGKEHVRSFKTACEFQERYKDYIDPIEEYGIRHAKNGRKFILIGRKK